MQEIKALVVALIVAVIGAALWAGFAHFFNIEIGLLAWGLGGAVGMAAIIGAGGKGHIGIAAIAVVCSILSIAGGKFAAVYLDVEQYIAENHLGEVNEEFVISYLADEVAAELENEGEELEWPDTLGINGVRSTQRDYPENVWSAAESVWGERSRAERDELTEEIEQDQAARLKVLREDATMAEFKASFNAFDLLWFGLAVFTAFKIGMSSAEEEFVEAESGAPPTEPSQPV